MKTYNASFSRSRTNRRPPTHLIYRHFTSILYTWPLAFSILISQFPTATNAQTQAASLPQNSASFAEQAQLPVHAPNEGSWSLFSIYPSVILQLEEGSHFLQPQLDGLFNHFEVIDERPDTARIGIHATHHKSSGSYNRQMVFSRPVAREVAAYLNRHFARPGAPYTAFVVLRTLWLSDASYIREELMKAPEKRFEKTKIRLKAEVYAARDSIYIPVFRFDSLLVSRKDTYGRFTKDLAAMLDHLADSSSILMTGRRGAGRSVSIDDIRAFNQSRFDMAICKDSLLRRGVYASYEEFRDNAPSIRDCEIRTEEGNLLVYIKEAGGRSWYCHKAWGYCDGKNIFVMKDGVLQPAWRENKALYFFGRFPAPNTPPPSPPGATVNSSMMATLAHPATTPGNDLSRFRIFTIDMDNGSIF